MYKIYIASNIKSHELLKRVLKKHHLNSEIIYNAYGKPYLKNEKVYFNLSDSGKYCVCVISDTEIGVDIERIVMKEKVIPKICTEEEQKKVKTAADFTKMWVKKESYVKYLGIGLSYGLKNVDTLEIKNIKVLKYEDYYIAICFTQD